MLFKNFDHKFTFLLFWFQNFFLCVKNQDFNFELRNIWTEKDFLEILR